LDILTAIIASLGAYLIITISPGPANLAVMNVSMRSGKLHGLSLGAGIVSGSVCWGMIAALGLSTFLSTNAYAFTIVKTLGGLYLCWMAYKALSSARKKTSDLLMESEYINESLGKSYLQGFIIHITNPKAVFAWASVMTLGLQPDVAVWSLALILIAGGCTLQAIVVGGYAVIFSTKTMMSFYGRSRKKIESVLGILFAGVGVNMLVAAFVD
jgi:threonine efflux protein